MIFRDEGIRRLSRADLVQCGEAYDKHREVWSCRDLKSGLKAIIAIHSLRRGPALGGCRMKPYESDEEALTDVLRLSRGMTYKSALADLDLGGGKTVIIGNPHSDKSDELLRALGRFVEFLAGWYIIAEDMGTDVEDLKIVAEVTKYVVGIFSKPTGDGGRRDGNPSRITAYGAYVGICTAVKHRLGLPTLKSVRIAIQGVGHVGLELCRFLAKDGAVLIVTDTNSDALDAMPKKLKVRVVAPDVIYDVKAHVFAPCAIGGIINDGTIKRLDTAGVSVVAGPANNQLAKPRHGQELARRNILYAVDYVINAGGVMDVRYDLEEEFNRDDLLKHLDGIGDTLMEIFKQSEATGDPTNVIADRMAEEILLNC